MTDPLLSWALLNQKLVTATEKECKELLQREKKGERRISFLLRIYGRWNKLRTTRERNEIMKEGIDEI